MFGSLCLCVLQLRCRWLCIYYAYIMHVHVPQRSFVVAVALACMHSNIYACNYVSAASVHTSKLPPWESVVLNTMTQQSQLQATSGDQSDGSSYISALHVKHINSKWDPFDMTTWCTGMHIGCTTQGCRLNPSHWQ